MSKATEWHEKFVFTQKGRADLADVAKRLLEDRPRFERGQFQATVEAYDDCCDEPLSVAALYVVGTLEQEHIPSFLEWVKGTFGITGP